MLSEKKIQHHKYIQAKVHYKFNEILIRNSNWIVCVCVGEERTI